MSARRPPGPLGQGAWLALAGAVGGLAVRDPAWFLAGWLSVAMVAAGLARWRASWAGAAGLLAGEAIGVWVALPWVWGAYDVAGGPGWQWVAVPPTTLLWALLTRAPLAAAWAIAGRRLPVWAWLPIAWIAGEAWLESAIGLQIDAWLYGQWQVAPVLRALSAFGWVPALGACLTLAAAAGAAAAGSRAAAGVALALGLAAFALPAIPDADASAVAGVGAVHMASLVEGPSGRPRGLTLLVWPEEAAAGHPRLDEGPASGARRLRTAVVAPGMRQLLGAQVRTPEGDLNAVVALAPDGRVTAVRGKRRLFPLVERPFLGMLAPHRQAYRAGRGPAWLDVGGRRVAALVCLEGFDRALALEARAAGASLIAIAANDQLVGAHPVGDRQMLGTAVLRAVESHLPVARASMFGRAALIAADGRVLAWSPPGATGVLTLAPRSQPLAR